MDIVSCWVAIATEKPIKIGVNSFDPSFHFGPEDISKNSMISNPIYFVIAVLVVVIWNKKFFDKNGPVSDNHY